MKTLFRYCESFYRYIRLSGGKGTQIFAPVLAAIFLYGTPAMSDDASIWQTLPFDRAPLAKLQASKHKACAVWHVWRLSVDNKPADADQYALQEMSPTGDAGIYFAAGGRMRERPLPRPVSSDPQWKIRDMETDIDRASAIGLDCFFLSTCTIDPGTICWKELLDLLDAANNRNNGFKIMPMMDVASLTNAKRTPADVAKSIASIASNPALMRDGLGRLYISATNGDLATAEWWAGIKSELANRGIPVSFVLTLQSYMASKNTYLPIVDGIGTMGAGTPVNVVSIADRVKELHSQGKIYVEGIKPQDFRPKKMWYLEPSNSLLFRSALTNAIVNGADWIMFNSWNDRDETTEFSPSTGTQWAFYDLAAYYISWFKSGSPPPIVRDVLYYFHRIMWTTTPFNTTKQPLPFYPHPSGGRQLDVNQIELLAFLVNPGTLQISIGGKLYTQNANAGITSFTVPLAQGTPSFKLIRNGATKASVTSAFSIRNTTTWQDLVYRGGSSTRLSVDMVANPAVTN